MNTLTSATERFDEWFIYIPEEGDWPIRVKRRATRSKAKRAYLQWAKRKSLPRGARIWGRNVHVSTP